MFQSPGEELWQAGIPDRGGGGGNVIFHPDDGNSRQRGVKQCKRGPGVAIARLTDAAGIDQVFVTAPNGIRLSISRDDYGYMRVANAAIIRSEMSEHLCRSIPRGDVFPVFRLSG